MNTAIVVTLIICGTIIAALVLGLLFTVWVINKGADMAGRK